MTDWRDRYPEKQTAFTETMEWVREPTALELKCEALADEIEATVNRDDPFQLATWAAAVVALRQVLPSRRLKRHWQEPGEQG